MSHFAHFRRKILFLCLFISLCTTATFAMGDTDILRVGLYHGNNALPTANLQNFVGSGYDFGYFNEDTEFVSVGHTDLEKITMTKDANLYFSDGTFTLSPPAGEYSTIGAYHLQVNDTYDSYEEAALVAQDYPYGFPAYVDGKYVVRFEFYTSYSNAQADQGNYSASVVGGSTTCYTVVDTTNGTILFEYDNDGYFAVEPQCEKEEAQTWFKGYKYYGAFEYARRLGGDMTVVNYVQEDLYVSCVLPYEFVSSGHIESLKAGAVAIRTFAHSSYKHDSSGFDVCNSTCCQVYRGVYSQANADKVLQACQETAGICAYYNGKLIEATYFASSGGATEDAKNTWGSDVPYLKGKEDPYEMAISYPGKTWEYFITPEQVTEMLQNRGNNNSTIVSIEVTERTAMGNVNALVFTDSDGREYDYYNDNVRLFSGISGVTYNSRNFSVTPADGHGTTTGNAITSVYDGTTTVTTNTVTVLTANGKETVSLPATVLTDNGKENAGSGSATTTEKGWYLTGGGYGHNVGMSQWGAYAMGDAGFTFDEILKFYYTGITVE